jgi:hypothetical protein
MIFKIDVAAVVDESDLRQRIAPATNPQPYPWIS